MSIREITILFVLTAAVALTHLTVVLQGYGVRVDLAADMFISRLLIVQDIAQLKKATPITACPTTDRTRKANKGRITGTAASGHWRSGR